MDSDGDGFANIDEINSLTFPGDPASFPMTRVNPVGGMGGTGGMHAPGATMVYNVGTPMSPAMGSDAASTIPMGFGDVATGGQMMTTTIQIPAYSEPVDVYMFLQAPAVDPLHFYFLQADGVSLVQDSAGGLAPWLTDTMGEVTHTPWGSMDTTLLPAGPYNFYLVVTPTGRTDMFDAWTFVVNVQ